MSEQRLQQLNSLIRRELLAWLAKHFETPAGAVLTVEEVTTSADLTYADVAISVFPEQALKAVLAALSAVRSEAQRAMRRRVHMQKLPTLRFRPDDREQRIDRMNRLLDRHDA